MTPRQDNEIPVAEAMAEAEYSADKLLAMAKQRGSDALRANTWTCARHWWPSAGTYVYHSHIAVSDQRLERLSWLSDIFFQAASLSSQPWYPQFKGGKRQVLSVASVGRIDDHQLCWGHFDLGLPSPRYYRQLVSLLRPSERCAIVVARSVTQGPPLPSEARLAYTLNPNGEVLQWRNGHLHWHHICCTPGAGVIYGRADRWLMNTLRWLRLDYAERRVYRCEAEQLRDWLQSEQPVISP